MSPANSFQVDFLLFKIHNTTIKLTKQHFISYYFAIANWIHNFFIAQMVWLCSYFVCFLTCMWYVNIYHKCSKIWKICILENQKIHQNLKKMQKRTNISIFRVFSNKIFKKCTIIDIHKFLIFYNKIISNCHGFFRMFLYLVKLEVLAKIKFIFANFSRM